MYSNPSTSNKHNVALKDTENDEINGEKTWLFCLKGT